MTEQALGGKVVAVTGGSRSLGLAFLRMLVREGAQAVLLGRPSADFDAVAAELPGCMAQVCDVRSSESVNTAFAAIGQRYGRLDGLVNNAAALRPTTIAEVDDAHLWSEVETNFFGPVLCSRAAIPLLRAAGGGDIVNLSSVVIEEPRPYFTLYAAAKAGIENFSAGLAAELRADDIRVTVLRSGPLTGGEISKGWDPQIRAHILELRQSSGLAARIGAPIAPEITAETLLHILTMPRGARLGSVMVRPM